jgi:D-beta-D-heptose 7-phosphate kinase/D-beta-D-heptose 1-phosphate adenosyltransferase
VFNDKIKSLAELKEIVTALKKNREKIAFTNGCFDILHFGHIKYLKQASLLADKLIVGINSDISVRKLKGNSRPIMSEMDRANIISALECVDYTIIFTQQTPLSLIKAIKPNFLVKGGDWKKSDIVGKKFVESYGGKVMSISFVQGYSTSSIISKIRKAKNLIE